jgi:ArsR family transcriptional regulator
MPGTESTARLFKALMHPARLEILDICHMEAALGFRQAYISQQLMVLREAGLVQDRRDGWNIFYRVVEPKVYDLVDTARRMSGDARPAARRKLTKSARCPCPRCNAVAEAAAT